MSDLSEHRPLSGGFAGPEPAKDLFGGYRPDIDGLRAVAVLMVILFHALPGYLPGGYAGVDVFFVISGFLITGIVIKDVERERFSLWNFYARRCRRILPALLAVLFVTWLAARALLPLDELLNFGRHMKAGAFFYSNLLLNSEVGYFDRAADLKPLRHLWSLAVEEQFYLLWPGVLWLALKTRRAMTTALVLLAASFAWNLARVRAFPEEAFYLLPSRFWELLLGCLLAVPGNALLVRLDAFRRNAAGRALLAALPAALLLTFLLYAWPAPFPGWAALLPTLAAALYIANGPGSFLNRRLSGRGWIFIGKISYPAYLWHWPLFSLSYHKLGKAPGTAQGLGIAALSLALAALTWRFIELRAQNVLFRSVSVPRRDRAWVAAGVCVLLSAGLAGHLTTTGLLLPENQKYMFSLARYRDYRAAPIPGSYFLGDPGKGWRDFPAGCLDEIGGDRDAVLIWGDSYAERLSYGLAKYLGPSGVPVFNIGGSACPPILGYSSAERPNCRGINYYVMGRIPALRPGVVLLSADWLSHYRVPGMTGKLAGTVKELRRRGVRHVLVAGQTPIWRMPLYKMLMGPGWSPLPGRSGAGLADIFGVDTALERALEGTGAEYVRLLPAFCGRDGCLLSVGNGVSRELVAFDAGHLTDAASYYAARMLLGPKVRGALNSCGGQGGGRLTQASVNSAQAPVNTGAYRARPAALGGQGTRRAPAAAREAAEMRR